MRRIFATLGLLALFSLPLSGREVRVEAPADLQSAWERLLVSHPLPAGLEAAPARVSETAEAVGSAGTIILRSQALPGFRIVERSVLVPVARFWDAPPSLT